MTSSCLLKKSKARSTLQSLAGLTTLAMCSRKISPQCQCSNVGKTPGADTALLTEEGSCQLMSFRGHFGGMI